MFNARIFKFGLVAIIASVLSTAEARPKKDKEKPEKPHPEKKIDREKIKERLKAAFDKRKKRRGDAKKRGHKVRGHGGHAFGKLIRDDAKIKELREAFKKATEKMKGGFDKSKWKDATDEGKAALRDKLKASRKDWADAMKAHHKEVHARIKEIREEFKNNRDKVIDGNEPGE
jgi:hypothetical protein